MSRPIVLGELYQTPIQESSAGIGCLRFCGRSICSLERSWLKEKGACMDTALTGLFDRIREKCRRDSWYGGKLDLRLARSDHPQRRGFTYPPASEEQLRATEAALGFPLPPFLRALYAEVANDCFGPGGYGSCTDEPDSTIVVDYAWHCQIGTHTWDAVREYGSLTWRATSGGEERPANTCSSPMKRGRDNCSPSKFSDVA